MNEALVIQRKTQHHREWCTIAPHENMKEIEFPEHIKDKKTEEERNVGNLRCEPTRQKLGACGGHHLRWEGHRVRGTGPSKN